MAEGERSRRHHRAAAEEVKYIKTPADVLTQEILTRMPVKSLLKNHSLVCREWRQVISSPRFTRIHLSYSNQRPPRILIAMEGGMVDYEDAPDAFYDPRNEITPKIPFPPLFTSKSVRVLGSCDGLVCLICYNPSKLAVFNPSTRKFALHSIGSKLGLSLLSASSVSWFGRHPSTEEYTLVAKHGVYKLNSLNGSYLPIEFNKEYTMEGIGTMLNGTIHWAAWFMNQNKKLSYAIFGYDLRNNETVEVPLPEHFQFRHGNDLITLGVGGGCLLLIFKNLSNVFEIWIMREYGVKESWTKYANIEGFEQSRVLWAPVGFCSDGDLMVEADMGIFVNSDYRYRRMLKKYSFVDRVSTLVKDAWSSSNQAIAFVPSLVSPDQVMFNSSDIDSV